ncbi:MAG: nitroreductase family protein [Cryomorphaceae bacterium]|nr:nitroreductase family protein [Cryomorphaceae bacterium]
MHSEAFQSIVEFRRSNRKFDPAIEVPEEVMMRSLERTVLSPNSSNMQLWEFHWIHDKKLIQEFVPLCLGQNAASTAKELVVFVTRRDLYKRRARWNKEQILTHLGDREPNKIEKNGLNYYGKVMPLLYGRDMFGIHTLIRRSVCFIGGLFKPFMRFGGRTDQRIMVHKSCALAAQTFMLSIAAEGFHTCPMEGFDKWRVRRKLGLPLGAEINMIISVGKGTEPGIWGPRFLVDNSEVIIKH